MKSNRILQDLPSLFFAMRQIIRQKLPEGHADPNGWMRSETLRFIHESSQPTMQEIASHLRITAPSATSLVANLARLGLIERKQLESDKRVVRIYLSKRGKQEYARYKSRSVSTMRKVFSKLSAKDIEQLRRILKNLQDAHRSSAVLYSANE